MTRRTGWWGPGVTLAVVGLAALACVVPGLGMAVPEATPVEEPTMLPTSVPIPKPTLEVGPTEALPTEASLAVLNESNIAICEAWAGPAGTRAQDIDLLGETWMLVPGEQVEYPLAEGDWDVVAADCHANLVDEQLGLPVTGDTTWTIGGTYEIPASLTVSNDSNYEFCEFYLGLSNVPGTWSKFATGVSFPRGVTHTFYLDEGLWDFAVETCHGVVPALEKDVYVMGDQNWELTEVFSQSETATVVNDTATTICVVTLAATTVVERGREVNSGASIPPGASFTFNVAEGYWDLRAFDCDDALIDVEFAAYTYGDYTWTIDEVWANHVTVRITNALSDEVCAVYVRSSDEAAWGEDLLDGATIPPGGQHKLIVDMGTLDFQALGCDGTVMEEHYGKEFPEETLLEWTIDGQ